MMIIFNAKRVKLIDDKCRLIESSWVSLDIRGGSRPFFLCLRFWIITNSYFIVFLMFICQNVGNFKGFLLVCLY